MTTTLPEDRHELPKERLRSDIAGEVPVEDVRQRAFSTLAFVDIDAGLPEFVPALQQAHRLMVQCLGADQVEPLERFRCELSNESTDCKFFCVALKTGDTVQGVIYGSVQKTGDEVIVAPRILAVDQLLRGNLVFYNGLKNAFVAKVSAWARGHSARTTAWLTEAVDDTVMIHSRATIDLQHGLRCLHIPKSAEQLHYEMPPIEWNKDGTAKNQGVQENLMIAVDTDTISVERFENILRALWGKWYIRPESDFDDNVAWEKHKQTVWGIFEDKIMSSIRESGSTELAFFSPKEMRTMMQDK